MDATFLVTFYAQPNLLKVCLDSIRKFYPNSRIIVSQQHDDDFEPIRETLEKYRAERIEHNMKIKTWVYAAIGLAEACKTDMAVYMEHDTILLRNIDDMFKKITDREYDLIGVEEVISTPELNRKSPGFMNQNFFIINMKKMKEVGLDKMKIDYTIPFPKGPIRNQESGYGISQSLDNKLFLPVESSGYASGTYYGDIAHHMWYGSYPKRAVEYDNINRLWITEEAERLIKAYWENKI
jgi:hypothetical protein